MEVFGESMSRSRVEKLCKANETKRKGYRLFGVHIRWGGVGTGPVTAGGLT